MDIRVVEQKVFVSDSSSVVQRVLGEVGRMDRQKVFDLVGHSVCDRVPYLVDMMGSEKVVLKVYLTEIVKAGYLVDKMVVQLVESRDLYLSASKAGGMDDLMGDSKEAHAAGSWDATKESCKVGLLAHTMDSKVARRDAILGVL